MPKSIHRQRKTSAVFMITWLPKYEIGITKIDFEHKIFLSLIQDFATKIDEKPDQQILKKRVLEIKKYAEFHFFSEENFMEEIGYPELEIHRNFHNDLLRELEMHINALGSENYKIKDFLDFVIEWFIAHTTQEDIRIAKFMRDEPF